MVLLKKRTLLSACGAIILALGAVCALYISRDKPAMSTVRPLPSAEILVLDAGHGGEDGGAETAAYYEPSELRGLHDTLASVFSFSAEQVTIYLVREGEG